MKLADFTEFVANQFSQDHSPIRHRTCRESGSGDHRKTAALVQMSGIMRAKPGHSRSPMAVQDNQRGHQRLEQVSPKLANGSRDAKEERKGFLVASAQRRS